jgi:hypothetical protein
LLKNALDNCYLGSLYPSIPIAYYAIPTIERQREEPLEKTKEELLTLDTQLVIGLSTHPALLAFIRRSFALYEKGITTSVITYLKKPYLHINPQLMARKLVIESISPTKPRKVSRQERLSFLKKQPL